MMLLISNVGKHPFRLSGLEGAIRLYYRSEGCVEVAPFDDEPYADHWFSKRPVSER
jgi:hypothetical protein